MGKVIPIGPYSAYAIAVQHGYEGTEEEWINSVERDRIAAEKAAKEAKEFANADPTLTISGAPADAAITGQKLDDRYTKAEIDDKLKNIKTDKTLSVDGGFADAKAVGDRLTPLEGFAGGYLGIWTITLNTNGWISKENWTEHVDMAGYNYQCIVELPSATVATIPFAVPTPETFSTAITAGLAGVCETGDGTITFWAENVPESDIQMQVALFGPLKATTS